MEVSFSAEPIFTFGQFAVTNTLLTSITSSVMLIIFSLFILKKLRLVPNILQNIVEVLIESLYKINLELSGEKTKLIFPWFATFFLFILIGNWMGLLPGFGSIGFYHVEHGKTIFTPLLRSVNTDLNMTLALAVISLMVTHILSIHILGIKEYIGRFVSLNPINLFVGILEIISEFTKLASLSLRLFGNIFAGEAVLTTTSSFLAFIVPLPFLLLEVVVGFVQALIFAMLTMAFMTILTTSHTHVKEEVNV